MKGVTGEGMNGKPAVGGAVDEGVMNERGVRKEAVKEGSMDEGIVSKGAVDEGTVVEGTVTHGRQLGRELGFPTANLSVAADFPLPDGVYRSRAEVGGRWYDGMSNLGCNPTVGGGDRRLETHLFDFSGELYGQRLRVELFERIRGERTFSTVEELRAQIAADRAAVTALLGK